MSLSSISIKMFSSKTLLLLLSLSLFHSSSFYYFLNHPVVLIEFQMQPELLGHEGQKKDLTRERERERRSPL